VKHYLVTISTWDPESQQTGACDAAEAEEVLMSVQRKQAASCSLTTGSGGETQLVVALQEQPYYIELFSDGRRRCVAKIAADYPTSKAIAQALRETWNASDSRIARQELLSPSESDRFEDELMQGPLSIDQWSTGVREDAESDAGIVFATRG
jgi:hypothetical protein